MPEFLRTLDLFETPTLKFNGGTSVGISGKDGKSSSKYTFADKSVIVAPTKTITMPDTEIAFKLTKDNLSKLMKGKILTYLTLKLSVMSTISLVANDRKQII